MKNFFQRSYNHPIKTYKSYNENFFIYLINLLKQHVVKFKNTVENKVISSWNISVIVTQLLPNCYPTVPMKNTPVFKRSNLNYYKELIR